MFSCIKKFIVLIIPFLRYSMEVYNDLYKLSLKEPERFWKEQASKISWKQFPQNILTRNTQSYASWFSDGMLNMSYLCIDKHIEDGFGDATALIYDSPVTNRKRTLSFNDLYSEVSRLAGGLQKLGACKGDTVLIYMPMIPQAVFSMLACARLGITHTVVFGGFAPNELAVRIDDCKPKIILTASSGVEVDRILPYKPFVDAAIESADHKPDHVVLYKRYLGAVVPEKKYDIDYDSLVNESSETDAVMVESAHPLYVLHTSGTTGKPKGIVRDTGGYATALKFTMEYIYNVNPGDAFWAASDVGWVVGHSFIVYGPLLNRNATVLYEGKPVKTPDASSFWRIISEYRVRSVFAAPTAIRAIRKEDPDALLMNGYDISCLNYFFLAGERSDSATVSWLKDKINRPVIDHWWQTESGWPMASIMTKIDEPVIKPGSVSKAVCGFDIRIVDEEGNELPPNKEGFVVVKLPLPPGTLTGIWNGEERFVSSYLTPVKGFYFTGDGGYKDSEDFIYITGRVDDVINVAGHRLSTAEMEEVISAHPGVAECAVFGIHDSIKGQTPLALIVAKPGYTIAESVTEQEIAMRIRSEIGTIASLKRVISVERLPKTRSGKILRRLLRDLADKKEVQVPSTIDDPAIIDEIVQVYQQHKI